MTPDIQTADTMLQQIATASIDDDWVVSCLALADMLEEHHGRAGDLAAGLRWMAEHRERPVQKTVLVGGISIVAGWTWNVGQAAYETFIMAVKIRGAECRGWMMRTLV